MPPATTQLDKTGNEEVPALEAIGISKAFGGTTALNEANFSCNKGEIHVLLGANGAGKSTMVKILTGVHPADSGTIHVNGSPMRLHSPLQATVAGVAAVFQELSLSPHLTVAENVMLAHEPVGRLGQISTRTLQQRVHSLFERLNIDHISPNTLVHRLTLADRQLVEITKALSHDPQTLFVDEGTSALGRDEVRRLFDLLNHLRNEGRAIIFISHRMAEVRELADRMTVFRNGVNVGTFSANEVNDDELIEHMLGQRAETSFPPIVDVSADAQTVLEVDHLSAGDDLKNLSFSIRAGEILGIAGLEGQGQGELLLALFGVIRRLTGTVSVHGKQVRLGTPWRAKKAGFALIPEDRGTQGLLQPSSLRVNIVMPSLKKMTRLGLINRQRERETALEGMQRVEIKASSMELPAQALSGGNQQKVVIAKWLAAGGDVFLFYDPTRGVDVGTKSAFYSLIDELASAGKAVLIYTTELPEFVGLCHRVLVMNDHQVIKELKDEEITENNILSASLGVTGSTTQN